MNQKKIELVPEICQSSSNEFNLKTASQQYLNKKNQNKSDQLQNQHILFQNNTEIHSNLRIKIKKLQNLIQIQKQEIKEQEFINRRLKQQLEISQQKVSNYAYDLQKLYFENQYFKVEFQKLKIQKENLEKNSSQVLKKLYQQTNTRNQNTNLIDTNKRQENIEKTIIENCYNVNEYIDVMLLLDQMNNINNLRILIKKRQSELNEANLKIRNYDIQLEKQKIKYQQLVKIVKNVKNKYDKLIIDYKQLQTQKSKLIQILEEKMKLIQREYDNQSFYQNYQNLNNHNQLFNSSFKSYNKSDIFKSPIQQNVFSKTQIYTQLNEKPSILFLNI